MNTQIELRERVEKATAAHDKAVSVQETLRAQFERDKLILSPHDYAAATARMEQQAQIIAAALIERDAALSPLNQARTAEAEREQCDRDEQELKDMNAKARLLSAEIDRLNAEARSIPARLQATHGAHTQTLRRIAELQEKLTPSPKPQAARWYSEEVECLANRLAKVMA